MEEKVIKWSDGILLITCRKMPQTLPTSCPKKAEKAWVKCKEGSANSKCHTTLVQECLEKSQLEVLPFSCRYPQEVKGYNTVTFNISIHPSIDPSIHLSITSLYSHAQHFGAVNWIFLRYCEKKFFIHDVLYFVLEEQTHL